MSIILQLEFWFRDLCLESATAQTGTGEKMSDCRIDRLILMRFVASQYYQFEENPQSLILGATQGLFLALTANE